MREDSLYNFLIQETFFRLVEHLCDLTRTYGATTLTDSETQTYVQSNSINQLNLNLHVITHPGVITPHKGFKASIYVLKKEEGGRHTPFGNKYRPQFYLP